MSKHCGIWSWNAKKNIADQKTCWSACCSALTLVQGSAMEIWLWVINEMCLQGLNLSSTKDTVFNHELALLQQAMNAKGICSPREWKHQHSGMNISECLYANRVVLGQSRSCAFSEQPAMAVSTTMDLGCDNGEAAATLCSLNQNTRKYRYLDQKSSSTAHI